MEREELDRRLGEVRERLARAAERGGRDATAVRVVAVTKGHPLEVVRTALAAGLRDLGENRLDELEGKAARVAGGGVRWHMIGHLQRRKAPGVRGLVHLLHSLDSSRLAERFERTAPEGAPSLPVLVQVNTSGEEAKGGFEPDAIERWMEALLSMKTLKLEGLMTMAPYTGDEGVLRATFARLRDLQEALRARFPEYRGRELSMGMSNDFEVAVEEGSTIVRLGTVLFGERPE
ncbi:MAG: YggS family pyridoxal phosphate-dependent enzyme [Gemmatimonadota bacterium]